MDLSILHACVQRASVQRGRPRRPLHGNMAEVARTKGEGEVRPPGGDDPQNRYVLCYLEREQQLRSPVSFPVFQFRSSQPVANYISILSSRRNRNSQSIDHCRRRHRRPRRRTIRHPSVSASAKVTHLQLLT